jgi:hypothetical protein
MQHKTIKHNAHNTRTLTHTATHMAHTCNKQVGASILRFTLPDPGTVEQSLPMTQQHVGSGMGASGSNSAAAALQAARSQVCTTVLGSYGY